MTLRKQEKHLHHRRDRRVPREWPRNRLGNNAPDYPSRADEDRQPKRDIPTANLIREGYLA